MSTSVLVTGGAGFAGSHLAELLVAEGLKVAVLDDLSRGRRDWIPRGCALYEIDIRDAAGVNAAVAACRPDVVAHLAALHFIPAVDGAPDLASSINVDGSSNIVAAARRCGVRRLLFASTAAVYPDATGPIPESTPTAPIDLYGRTKVAGERLVRAFVNDTDASAVVARLFNLIGPRETNPHVVPEIVEQIAAGADEVSLGNVEPERDFTDVRDAAEALRRLLLEDAPGVGVFNVGTGIGTSVADVVATCSRLVGRPVGIRRDHGRVRAIERMRLVADNSALTSTGWKPRFTVADTLRELLEAA